MRILFIADGRSPTTLSWLGYWINRGEEVHLVSTYPCNPPSGLASFHEIPIAFARVAGVVHSTGGLLSRLKILVRPLRYILGPLGLSLARRKLNELAVNLRPDLVHALRIPFEGMLASDLPASIPLLVSIWGNDITLHAHRSEQMGRLTRRVLRRANGLLADTQRDLCLGREWGLDPSALTLAIPGSGGICLEKMDAFSQNVVLPDTLPEPPLVINPRGHRPGSIRQDIFLRSIPYVLEKIPGVNFVCPALLGEAQAEKWVDALGINRQTHLWPKLSQGQLWALMKYAKIYVSPSIHDGTPNSLLEAMACRCFPIVGNIESMQEWIINGVNGFLIDATSETQLAEAIVRALIDTALQDQAANYNAAMIAERADYQRNMLRAKKFYDDFLTGM